MKCSVCQSEISEQVSICPFCGALFRSDGLVSKEIKIEPSAEHKALESIKKIKEKEILTKEEKEAALLFGREKKILRRIRPAIFWWTIIFLLILAGLGGVGHFLSKRPFEIVPEKTYASYLPAEASLIATVDLDKINQLQDLKLILDKIPFLNNFSFIPVDRINRFLDDFNLDFKTSIRPLVDRKIYLCQTNTVSSKQFLLLSLEKTEAVKALIENLEPNLAAKKMVLTKTHYQNNIIYNLNKEIVEIPPRPGGAFQPFLSFIFVDQYLIISDQSENISFLIDVILDKKTFDRNLEYKTFILSYFDEQALLSVYLKDLNKMVLNFFPTNEFLKIAIFKYIPEIEKFIGTKEDLFAGQLLSILPGKPSYYLAGSSFQTTVNLQKFISSYLENKLIDWQNRLTENNLDLDTDILAWLNKEYALGFYDYKLSEPAIVFMVDTRGNQDKAYTAIGKIKTVIEDKLKQNYPKEELKFKEIDINEEKVNILELPKDVWYGLDIYYVLRSEQLVVTTSKELMELVLATIAGQNKDVLSQNKFLNNLKNQLPSGSSLVYWHQGGADAFYKKSINELTEMNPQWVKENQFILDAIAFLGRQLNKLFSAGGISHRIQKDGALFNVVIQKR